MADKNVVEEVKEEVKELVESPETPEKEESSATEETKSDEKKTTIEVPKWLLTTLKVIEGIAAAFGGLVAGFMIKDTISKRKKKTYISRPVYRDEIPTMEHRSILETVSEPESEVVKTDF